jgi:hypothetical protein
MSTHTGNQTVPELAGAGWFKSSYSGNGTNCVEAADLTRTRRRVVAVRDSKNPGGPALLFSAEAFAAFIGSA